MRAIIILAFAISGSTLCAAPVTFTGEDLNGSTNRIAFPNATAARDTFLSWLTATGEESFEAFSNNAPLPLGLNFGAAGTGTLTNPGGNLVRTWTLLSGTDAGMFPTSGNVDLELYVPTVSLGFSSPTSAFGFFATDMGDAFGTPALSLTFHFAGGGSSTVSVPHTVGSLANGAVLFFGYINFGQPFTSVDISSVDIFAVDQLVIGTPVADPSVPEPGSATMAILGAVILGCHRVISCRGARG